MPRSPRIISYLPNRLKPAGARVVLRYRKLVRDVDRLTARWFPKPKTVAHIPIKDFLEGAHFALLDLQRRQYLLEALDAEWPRITLSKPYWIHDDATFRALGDVLAMNVIDLCSWGIGASDTDERLLLRVKNHYLADLPPSRRWPLSGGSSPAHLADDSYAKARARLFPKAASRPLTERDADDLIEAFEGKTRPLRDDRNKNRAHRHEHKTHGTANPLEIAAVRALYKYARSMLNDLSLVSHGTTWTESDINSNPVAATAEDLLDVVFLPHWFRQRTAGGGLSRTEIYASLHADPAPGHFNATEKLLPLATRIAPPRAARTAPS